MRVHLRIIEGEIRDREEIWKQAADEPFLQDLPRQKIARFPAQNHIGERYPHGSVAFYQPTFCTNQSNRTLAPDSNSPAVHPSVPKAGLRLFRALIPSPVEDGKLIRVWDPCNWCAFAKMWGIGHEQPPPDAPLRIAEERLMVKWWEKRYDEKRKQRRRKKRRDKLKRREERAKAKAEARGRGRGHGKKRKADAAAANNGNANNGDVEMKDPQQHNSGSDATNSDASPSDSDNSLAESETERGRKEHDLAAVERREEELRQAAMADPALVAMIHGQADEFEVRLERTAFRRGYRGGAASMIRRQKWGGQNGSTDSKDAKSPKNGQKPNRDLDGPALAAAGAQEDWEAIRNKDLLPAPASVFFPDTGWGLIRDTPSKSRREHPIDKFRRIMHPVTGPKWFADPDLHDERVHPSQDPELGGARVYGEPMIYESDGETPVPEKERWRRINQSRQAYLDKYVEKELKKTKKKDGSVVFKEVPIPQEPVAESIARFHQEQEEALQAAGPDATAKDIPKFSKKPYRWRTNPEGRANRWAAWSVNDAPAWMRALDEGLGVEGAYEAAASVGVDLHECGVLSSDDSTPPDMREEAQRARMWPDTESSEEGEHAGVGAGSEKKKPAGAGEVEQDTGSVQATGGTDPAVAASPAPTPGEAAAAEPRGGSEEF